MAQASAMLKGTMALLLVLACSACAPGRFNANCEWPYREDRKSLNSGRLWDRWHLDNDALIAEDLAIRYSDRVSILARPVQWEIYRGERDQCMTKLLGEIAGNHSVSTGDVRQGIGRRFWPFDAAVLLLFSAFYLKASLHFLRRIAFRIGDNALAFAFAAAVLSVFFAGIATLGGELWSGFAECLRVLNLHGSYRVLRTPWTLHRELAFAVCLVLFWLAGVYGFRTRNAISPKKYHERITASLNL